MEPVDINGKNYQVEMKLTKNRTAIARLEGRTIVVTLPSRWSRKDKEETFQNLLKRSVKAIRLGRWTEQGSKKLSFNHGQTLKAFGKEFRLDITHGKRFGSRNVDNRLHINVAEHPKKDEKCAALVRKEIVDAVMPDLRSRILEINEKFFNAKITKIRVRDTLTVWGSCSRDGTIMLNFRLLFMPPEILDYVIAHELAHTKYMSHGPRFWGIVEKAIPNHRERRRWLVQNGWSYPKIGTVGQQKLTDFILR